MSLEKTINLFKEMLEANNIDLNDPNFLKTPTRAGKAFHQFLKGYTQEEIDEVLSHSFPSKLNDMVIIRDIPAYMLCPHHLLPCFLRINIGYIPNGTVLGLSKFKRLAKIITQKPLLQEELTEILADIIYNNLKPDGVMITVVGKHMCMCMRGIEQPDSKVSTSAVRGNFVNHQTKSEFLDLINGEDKL